MAYHGVDLNAALRDLRARAADYWSLHACGVTRMQTSIPALVHRDAYAASTPCTRVLLIGGFTGQADDVTLALRTLEIYLGAGDWLKQTLALSAVPCANPDGLTAGSGPENSVGGRPGEGYPPADNFFYDAHNPERRYLWRWAGLHAPDLLLEVRTGTAVTWEASAAATALAPTLRASNATPADSLLAALGATAANGLGPIPGLRLTTAPQALEGELNRLWDLLARHPELRPSPARRVLNARRARTPLQIARLLATVYGHSLDPVVYTLGMGLSGRLRLARLDPEFVDPAPDIVQLVEPYVSGAKPMWAEPATTTALAGLMWGLQLTEATRDRRYAQLIANAAEHYRPGDAGGAPPPSDPEFRTEDMFMNGAMLGRAFQFTGEARYLDLLTQFLLNAHIQQDNGLFWHCRSAPYYWGRGNGFAVLGFCETLSFLPIAHPDRTALLDMHTRHLEALRQRQLPSGMYPQVLDVPGSYEEFTITCMLGYAMAHGLRRGWLDPSYRPAVEHAWQGVTERIDEAGGLVDCCTNTGVQTSRQAYIDRPAIFGRDDRGGAMALWFALELEQLQRERQ
jgi:unsaturated rhamnogalacturonyl hydrolase